MNKTIKFLTTLLLLAVSVGAWAEDITAGSLMTEIASANKWTTSSGNNVLCYTSFSLDENITISTTGNPNCGSFWGSDWRLYQNQNGNVIVSAAGNCVLKKVSFTYTVSNNGVLKDSNNNNVATNTETSISGTSATFTVGNTNNKTNGQVRITAISVTYEITGSSDLQTSDLALTGAPVALNFDLYNNSSAQTVNYTTSSTGAVTISGGTGYVTTSVSGNTITVTPVAVTPSPQTITVSQAADDEYEAGSVTFTVSVANSATYTVTFDAGNGTFVPNNDFPTTSNSKTAGIYTLPSATAPSGYTFTGWTATGINTPVTGSYDINSDIDFIADYTQGVTHTYNFAGADNFYTDANLTTHPSTGSNNKVNAIYYGDGSEFDAGGSGYFSAETGGYFLMGKAGAEISLPTFDGYKITQVKLHSSTGHSTNVAVSIVSGENMASAAQTWSTKDKDYTYNIASDYQTSALSVKVTNDYNTQFTSITLVCEPSSDITISADDVDILYNATSGSIAYTINNEPNPAGTLTAAIKGTSEIANLTLGTVANNAVPFTCDANTSATARTATVTLTYTYNTNETVTKDITVTQAGSPNVINNISDITAVNENYAIRGTIVAKSSRGLVIGDGTGYLYYYNQNYSQSDYNVGDMVKMSGTMGSYNHVYQFTSTATIETSETSNYNNTPAVQVLDATAIAAYSENLHLSDYVQLEGTLVKSGNYYNLEVEGLDTDASISYPTTEQAGQLDALENEIVIVKGYFVGVSSYHFNVVLESIEEKQLLDNAINGLEDAYTIDMTQGQEDLTLNATATSGATVQYEVISEGTTLTEDDYVLEGNELVVSKRGTIVIRAYVAADDEYKAAEKVITVTVLGAKEEAVVAVSDKTLECGGSYTLVENDDYQTDGEITMTSSNPLVASVDGLTVTAAAVGTATITVNAAEGTNYAALVTPATFTVTVTSPVGQEEAPSTEALVLLNESFSESDGENVSFGGQSTDGNGAISYDCEGWEAQNISGADGSAKIGASKKKGSATTPELTVVIGETYTLTFKAAPWASESTTMNITVEGGTITGVSTDAMTTGEWNEYSATITASSTSMSVTFEASKNRFFLDEVKIEKPAEAVGAPKLTLSASGYASYCCEYPLDFTNIDKDTFKAWYVSAVDMTSGDVTFTEITGTIKGGEAFFLYGTPGAECQLAYAESSSVVLNGNKLVGTLAPTYVENGNGIQNYGLSGGNFVKMGNGVVKANKSYLPVEVGTETPTRFNIIFESQEATGIMNVSREGTTDNRYYNLNGQRVMNPTKGMYIVNGKKVIIK